MELKEDRGGVKKENDGLPRCEVFQSRNRQREMV